MSHLPNKVRDNKQDKRSKPLLTDHKSLLEILELVESQHKLAAKHYELWKNLLHQLTKEK